MALMIY